MVDGNCDSTSSGTGCAIISDSHVSYCEGFNAGGGGVFVTLWDGDGVKICTYKHDRRDVLHDC